MKRLMKGNEAVAEAAIRGGCRAFFGYPITPQNEIPEYCARRMPEVGGVFLQAESELAAVNMVYGAAASGVRAMTSSSSPGISLKQEGISYLAACQLPAVIVNMVRGGPGLGGIQPAQSDYFQAVKGGGHGDYHLLVFAPSTIQEAVDLMYDAHEKAEKYRTPVMLLGDGMLGQMMESVSLPPMKDPATFAPKSWACDGKGEGAGRRIINSLLVDPDQLEDLNHRLFAGYEAMQAEVRSECYLTEDATVVLVAYGTMARIARSAVDLLRASGVAAGLFRPITLYPFPTAALAALGGGVAQRFVSVELSMGQMIEDVRLALNGAKPVSFVGKVGGNVLTPEQIADAVRKEETGYANV